MKPYWGFLPILILILPIILSPVSAQDGIDDREPNDSRETASAISGLEIHGGVSYETDKVDWFVLPDKQEGIYPIFTLAYDSGSCDIDLNVYSDDELVGKANNTESPDKVRCYVKGVCYLEVQAFDNQGEYTITIKPGDENDLKSCEGTDETEPNDIMSCANKISALDFKGYACLEDSDWFELDGNEGENPTITLIYDDGDCDIDLEVYSDGEYVESLSEPFSPDSGSFAITGKCLLHVIAFEGKGAYEVKIEP
ncbi:MAG: hypothetical protein ABIC40_03170 [bacterium]